MCDPSAATGTRCPERSQEGAQCIHEAGHNGSHFAKDAFSYYSWETPRAASAAYAPQVGDRVVLVGHDTPYSGERGVITNSPGKVFNGWAVKLDNGRVIGVDRKYLRAES